MKVKSELLETFKKSPPQEPSYIQSFVSMFLTEKDTEELAGYKVADGTLKKWEELGILDLDRLLNEKLLFL